MWAQYAETAVYQKVREPDMKYKIERNTVQETLILPLYSRKLCSELYPNLYRDETAVRLIDQIDYDFSVAEKKSHSLMQRFGQQRTAQGGIPIYNPTIARVKVHYDIFLDSYERQKNLQALTNRSLEELASMRGRADELILDIWNQVETKYQDVTPNEVRLDKCRDYGLIYYYRSSEKVKEENELTC